METLYESLMISPVYSCDLGHYVSSRHIAIRNDNNFGIAENRSNIRENVLNFLVSTVSDDGLAQQRSRTSVDTMMTKI